MDNKIVTEYDCSTGETIVRDMNKEELKQYEADQAKFAKIREELKQKEEKRLALLARLGITEEEAALLAKSL